ncbi:MAG: ParA family protein [Rubrivivax sp.]
MPVVAVINRKGGSGKSTLATHLAGWCVRNGMPVMLGDVDRQQSSLAWLRRRAQNAAVRDAQIAGWAADGKSVLRPPAGVSHVVLDTPGALRGPELARVVMYADAIVMPLCASAFDRDSALECHAELMALPRVASGRCKVTLVGMRLDSRTKGAEQLAAWAAEHSLPYAGSLRETQTYVRCAELGLTLFDLPAAKVQADLDQWQPVVAWLRTSWRAAAQADVASRASAKPVTQRLADGNAPAGLAPLVGPDAAPAPAAAAPASRPAPSAAPSTPTASAAPVPKPAAAPPRPAPRPAAPQGVAPRGLFSGGLVWLLGAFRSPN